MRSTKSSNSFVAPRLPAYDGGRALALSTALVGVGYGMNAFAGSLP